MKLSDKRGFSLLEIAVCGLLGMFLAVGIAGLIKSRLSGRNYISAHAAALKEMEVVREALARDLALACCISGLSENKMSIVVAGTPTKTSDFNGEDTVIYYFVNKKGLVRREGNIPFDFLVSRLVKGFKFHSLKNGGIALEFTILDRGKKFRKVLEVLYE